MRPFEWIIVALLALVFTPAVLALSQVWDRFDYYSHGYLVPLVALWAATAQRHLLPTLPQSRDLRGGLLLALALALYLVGVATSLVGVQGLSIVLALAGGVLYLRGPAWLRALRFPIAFTIFMVPIPEPWITPLIARLQLIVSTGAVGILQQAGFSIYRDGNVMVLPGGTSLFVAEACSGITSIITLLPLAVFLGYFTQREFSKRALLVLAVIPVAMLGNGLRVVGTVVAAQYWGAEKVTHGTVHDAAGVAVYVVGCLGLVGLSAVLPKSAAGPDQPAV